MFNNNEIYQVLCDKRYREWKLKLQVDQHVRLKMAAPTSATWDGTAPLVRDLGKHDYQAQ
jgi:hypothetical protein